MKIKHFSGYGCVNAVKTAETKAFDNWFSDYPVKRVTIKVTGEHERGLHRNDKYDVYNWLVKRFCKDCKSYRDIIDLQIMSVYEIENNAFKDVCTYIIDYQVK
jgi:hypothetical protein